VIDGFGSVKGFIGMVRGTFSSYRDPHAQKLLSEYASHQAAPHANLVQIEQPERVPEEINA